KSRLALRLAPETASTTPAIAIATRNAISTIGSQSRQRPTVASAAIVESRYSRIKPSNGVAPISRAADAFALVMTDSVSGPVRDAPSPAVPAALGRSVSRTLAAGSSWWGVAAVTPPI